MTKTTDLKLNEKHTASENADSGTAKNNKPLTELEKELLSKVVPLVEDLHSTFVRHYNEDEDLQQSIIEAQDVIDRGELGILENSEELYCALCGVARHIDWYCMNECLKLLLAHVELSYEEDDDECKEYSNCVNF